MKRTRENPDHCGNARNKKICMMGPCEHIDHGDMSIAEQSSLYNVVEVQEAVPSTFNELEMFGSSSSSSSRSIWTYDVFLSFRGGDTRYDFTDHLYNALHQSGIRTFRDDNELRRGEEISQELQKAIQESRISVVVFSKDYASSRWCLDELTKILECRQKIGQVVLPIFYKIDPSNVRRQTGSYAEAFDKHKERFKEETGKVNKWREALLEAGNLSGWGLNEEENRYESDFIKKIVNEVSNKLGYKCMHVAKYPINTDSRVESITSLLSLIRNDVGIVGIHGIAGIGKTTIAKATFNKLRGEFDGSSFLSDVKGISDKNSLVELQKQLLLDILKTNVGMISNVDQGKSLIRERLGGKRVLVIFDNVDQREELDALMEERSWFGPGSKIIITTKNKHLLTQLEVDHMYHAKALDEHESLQLFSLHAFRKTYPLRDYQELSNKVIDYCKGLPLALEILGSHLFGRSKMDWENDIEQWQKIPNDDIHKKLKVSLDALNDDTREMFLDIAFFFVGRDKDDVAKILVARYDFNPEIAFRTLIERSLITINSLNELWMHDILRDIGREIIRQMSPRDPGKRNRIWHHKDAYYVLYQETGTEVVEGLVLNARLSEGVKLSTTTFAKMRSLKLLEINGLYLTGSFKHVSKLLIWLCWHGCPLDSLEPDLQLDNLVILDMQHSNVKELWKKEKRLNKLKILNLSYSEHLIKTPNLHCSSIEKLILEGCTSLIEVHQSVGHSKSLVILNLKGCCSLKVLPESIGDMETLIELLVDGSAIKRFPSWIGNLKKLRKLSLHNWNFSVSLSTSSRSVTSWLPSIVLAPFRSLTKLNLISSILCDDTITVDFGCLSSLKELDLSKNKFLKLPPGIDCLPLLEVLKVEDCRNLLSISELPSSLEKLEADRCTSLVEIPQSIGHLKRLHSLHLFACSKLKSLPSGIGHTPLVTLWIHYCTNLQLIPELPSSLKNLAANDCTSLVSVPIQPDTIYSLCRCTSLKEIKGAEVVHDWRNVTLALYGSWHLLKQFKISLAQVLWNHDIYEIWRYGGSVPEWFSHEEGHSLSFQVPATHSQKLVVWAVTTAEPNPVDNLPIPDFYLSVKIKTDDGIVLYDDPHIEIGSYDCSLVKHMVLNNMKGTGEQLELSVEIEYSTLKYAEVNECGVYVIEEKKAGDVEECCRDIGQGTASPAPTYDNLDPWKNYLLQELPNWDIMDVKIGKR